MCQESTVSRSWAEPSLQRSFASSRSRICPTPFMRIMLCSNLSINFAFNFISHYRNSIVCTISVHVMTKNQKAICRKYTNTHFMVKRTENCNQQNWTRNLLPYIKYFWKSSCLQLTWAFGSRGGWLGDVRSVGLEWHPGYALPALRTLEGKKLNTAVGNRQRLTSQLFPRCSLRLPVASNFIFIF